MEGITKYINSLPDIDPPEIFGMNDNADIEFQLQESQMMIGTVLSIQPRVGGGEGGMSSDAFVDDLAEKILAELPEMLTKDNSNKDLWKTNKEGLMESLSTYLLHEIQRFNILLQEIQDSIEEVRKAIKGEVSMSDELNQMYWDMLNNKVPEKWESKAYPSRKPLTSWMENLKERIAFFRKWLEVGFPVAFWMPSFFFPQGFLTSLLQ